MENYVGTYSLIENLVDFIKISGEYGKPTNGNKAVLAKILVKILNNIGVDNIDFCIKALKSVYEQSNCYDRDGDNFYRELFKSGIKTESDIQEFIDNYEFKNSRVVAGEVKELKQKEKDITELFNWGYESLASSPPKLRGINYEKILKVALSSKALMLDGAPGTGKTAAMRKLAYDISDGDPKRNVIMSFNSGIEYEDFIGGIQLINGNTIAYDGIFTEFCKRAHLNKEHKFCFAIEESSRAPAAKIFGESFSCLEYRDHVIKLRNGEDFAIPSNVYMVATMNSTDASVVHTDNAFFERWAHMGLDPQWNMEFMQELIEECQDSKGILERVIEYLNEFNAVIKGSLGAGNMIGLRSMSMGKVTVENIKEAIEYKLVPSMKHVASRVLRIDAKEELDDIVLKVEELLHYEV